MKAEVLPPHGFIDLKKWSGDELDIVNAARVSFANESHWDTQFFGEHHLSDKDKGLLNFLLRERHGTPFEQGMMAHWHIKCPIFVARQWFKHRIGCSYNEVSGRYTELQPEWYVPDKARVQEGKPGAYTFYESDNERLNSDTQAVMESSSHQAFEAYEHLVEQGVAKEQARMILPQNMYTEFRWTTNARSLMHFLSLRNDENAQWEIREYAEAIEQEFAKVLPTVYMAFVDNGRKSP